MGIPGLKPQIAVTKNASDPKQVHSAEKREKQIRWQELEDLRQILSLPAGRRFLWRALEYSGYDRDRWAPSAEIHLLAGMARVGFWLKEEIKCARVDAYPQMYSEQIEREREEEEFAQRIQEKNKNEESSYDD